MFDRTEADDWIRAHVEPTGPMEVAHDQPWSTVLRVPVAHGNVWFKACADVQAFEPRLTAQLFSRWPDRVPEVLGHDEARAWLLLADAGTELRRRGNPPEAWLELLPRYAELQRGEGAHAVEHVAAGVPGLLVATLPAQYEELLSEALPIPPDELARVRDFAPRFESLCAELATDGVPASIQHDDLHMNNVYEQEGAFRVLDWGDSCVSHPFASLVCTFRFLEERNGLDPGDPWFARLRDAYLEPWGSVDTENFTLAMRVGGFAHAIAALRQRRTLPEHAATFDTDLTARLRRALRLAGLLD